MVTAVWRVTNLEKQTDEMEKRMDDFQLSVQSRWDARTSTTELPSTNQSNVLSLKNEDEEFTEEFDGVIKSEDLADASPGNESEEFGPDDWLNAENGINLGEHGFQQGEVKKRGINADGKPIGTANDDLSLDSRAHKVEFSDGQTEVPTANGCDVQNAFL